MKRRTYNPREAKLVWGYIVGHHTPTDIAITADRRTAKAWKEAVVPDEAMPEFALVPRNKAAVKELALLRKTRRTKAAK